LSPCVLPLVPVLVAAAMNAHRWGALALGLGLTLSFTVVGIFLATLGASLGFDPDTFRLVGAVILALFGLVLLVPKLQDLFARATGILSNSGSRLLARVTYGGLAGQFAVGGLLGIVWSPCVGPTLGAASTLASQGKDLGQIALLMLIFGIGAALPLVLLGSLSRASMMKVRGRLLNAGKYGKQALGLIMLALGVLIATGADKSLEAWILDRTPDWLTALTTKY
jgi:cytochrome c-type biogenesis protein